MNSQPDIDAQKIADCVSRFRERRPHVHCITNAVAQHFTANVLLAAGATPSMTINPDEISGFVGMADGLLINLGTMDEQREKSAQLAVETANGTSKPWVLDPVFVQASPLRLLQAKQLMASNPALIRCNRNEAKALFGCGTEVAHLQDLSASKNTIVALTGPSDLICSAGALTCVDNGSALMDRITAMGCALTALMAGFIAAESERMLAAVSAAACFGLAGEIAEQKSTGPGTFVPAFLDALYTLSNDDIATGVRLS